MTESRPYATYVLVDPVSKQFRYIGKTKQSLAVRMQRHLRDANEKTTDGWTDRAHRANWIRSVLKQGLSPRIAELCRYRTLEEANRAEMFLIYHLRKAKADLTNATDGGDGGVVPRKPVVEDSVVIEAYRAGASSTKIARQFKTCKKRVLNVLKKAGVALRPSGRSKGT